jgi:hypothetical protein
MLNRIFWAIPIVFLSLVPAALAQDVSVVGIVTDESRAVLPGAMVTAREAATGRSYEDLTNERGEYRLLGMRPGRYELKAQLSGFSTVVLSNLEFLVGQNATVPITMKVAALEESVTVTAESPLVDLRSAQVAGNVDRRQMEDLPLSGRDWLQLMQMVPGVTNMTQNGVSQFGRFQLNLDGQQITQETSVTGFGQPGISRDAIAEYQVVTNLFDVTAGRSVGLEVQAISKSGTNNLAGSFYGYFRDDKLNSADPFTRQVLPYQSQQIGGTLGGPIAKDKMHYFVSYERERNPNTIVVHPAALAPQQITADTDDNKIAYLGRLDHQFSNHEHLAVRANYFNRLIPNDGITTHPSRGTKKDTTSYSATGNWSHVRSNGTLHEVRVGYYRYYWTYGPMDGLILTPEYQFPGLTIGLNWNYPEFIRQSRLPIRYDLSHHTGRHDLKVGGEWLIGLDDGDWPARSRGQWFFTRLPADATLRFPLDQDATHWDLSGLDSAAIRFDRTYATDFTYNVPRKTYAAWLGDTWAPSARLTVNLGVRYDLAWGDYAPPDVNPTDVVIDNGRFVENAGYRTGIRDRNNFAPRVGFSWNLTGSGTFVVRGGSGIFYSGIGANPAFDMQLWNGQRVIFNSYANDGLPGFVADPTRGVTADDILAGRVPLAPQAVSVIDPAIRTPRMWQSMVGFQKQLSPITGLDVNLVYQRGYNEESVRDPNVFFDAATGWPKNPVTAGRPRRDYGPIRLIGTQGRSEALTLPLSFTRRYRNNFQLATTYTLMFFKNDAGVGGSGYGNDLLNPFDIDDNWGRANDFARHTLRANGIWNLPKGFNLSGLLSYQSSNPYTLNSGLDPLGGYGRNRLRADLSFIPRNTFYTDATQSVDVRLAKDVPLGHGVKLTGIAEVFNLFGDTKTTYDVRENSRTFMQVSNITNIRTGQLAFKLSF